MEEPCYVCTINTSYVGHEALPINASNQISVSVIVSARGQKLKIAPSKRENLLPSFQSKAKYTMCHNVIGLS